MERSRTERGSAGIALEEPAGGGLRFRRRRGRAGRGSARAGRRGGGTGSAVPSTSTGTAGARAPMRSSIAMPMPPSRMPSSHVTTARWRAASASMSASSGAQQRTSQTVTSTPVGAERVGGLLGGLDELADGEDAHGRRRRRPRRAHAAGRGCRRRPRARRRCGPGRAGSGWRPGRRRRAPSRRASICCSSWALDGASTRMPGTRGEQRHVVHAVVARPVGTGDAGPVDAEHDRQAVQGDVVDDLVPGPVEERRVDRDDRAQPAHRHAGGAGDGVLLGDADVEEAVREAGLERQQARSARPSPR